MYTTIKLTDTALLTKLASCARGCYQRALLAGDEAWSGAGLQGKARSYGRFYQRSRENLVRRIRSAGILVIEERHAHGKRVMVIG
jgi:hypothetical protein